MDVLPAHRSPSSGEAISGKACMWRGELWLKEDVQAQLEAEKPLAVYMGTATEKEAREKLIAKWGYMPHCILGDAKNYQPVCTLPEGHIGFCGLVGPPSRMDVETQRVLRGEASGRTSDVGRPRLRRSRRMVAGWLERFAGEIRR